MAEIFNPKTYQTAIINACLTHRTYNVWSGMGTGKTVSLLTVLETMLHFGVISSALVVAPVRVAASTWPDEIAKWAHLKGVRPSVMCGTPEQRLAALTNPRANLFLINYENLEWLEVTLKGRFPFGAVVADEATRLKGFRLVQGGSRVGALNRMTRKRKPYFFNLTGTPAANGLIDLWGQNWFVDGGERLGSSYGAFRDRWFRQKYSGHGYEPMPYSEEQIHTRMQDCALTVEAKDYFDLPELVSNTLTVTLPPKAQAIYKEMEDKMFADLGDDGLVEAFNAGAKSVKCLQIASGALYTDDNGAFIDLHNAKLDALDDVIEDANGEPVLVAYHFKSDLARIKKRFKQAVVLDKDPDTIRRWNRGEIPLLLAHPASAGHGLNLQDGGRILVFFSHWWSLEEYSQIIERIGPTRQAQSGHPRTVYVHHLVAKGTLDEAVMAARIGKQEVQQALLDYTKHRGH